MEEGVTRDSLVIYVLSTPLAKASLVEQKYRGICLILYLGESDDVGDVEIEAIPTIHNIRRWL